MTPELLRYQNHTRIFKKEKILRIKDKKLKKTVNTAENMEKRKLPKA